MKHYIPTIFFSLISVAAAAQISAPTLDSTAKKAPFTRTLIEESNYSHSTSKGKIYTLPYDNMPSLVPDMNQVAQMPGSIQKLPHSGMPNAVPRRELIPKQRKPQATY